MWRTESLNVSQGFENIYTYLLYANINLYLYLDTNQFVRSIINIIY